MIKILAIAILTGGFAAPMLLSIRNASRKKGTLHPSTTQLFYKVLLAANLNHFLGVGLSLTRLSSSTDSNTIFPRKAQPRCRARYLF